VIVKRRCRNAGSETAGEPITSSRSGYFREPIYLHRNHRCAKRRPGTLSGTIWICTLLRATLTNDRMLLRSCRLFNDRFPPLSLSLSLPFSLPSLLTLTFVRIDRYGCNNRIWIKRSQRDSRTSAREDFQESLGVNSKAIAFVIYTRASDY